MVENQQFIVRKKAVISFVIIVFLSIIQISIFFLKLDRISRSVINMLIFWPLYLIALYQSTIVVGYCFRHYRSINILYLIMIMPAYAFLVYFIRELIISH